MFGVLVSTAVPVAGLGLLALLFGITRLIEQR